MCDNKCTEDVSQFVQICLVSGWGITSRSMSEAMNDFTRHLLPSLTAYLHADYVTNTNVILNALQSD